VKNKIFLDTLFLVALVNKRDQYHEQALELANQYENTQFLSTDIILFEVGNALSCNFKDKAVELIKKILDSDDIEIVFLTPELFEQAFSVYQQHQDKDWGLVDCLSFVVMKQNNINQALTFDRHFIQAGFQALMR
jgi:predicted nucleic acid-binding protein